MSEIKGGSLVPKVISQLIADEILKLTKIFLYFYTSFKYNDNVNIVVYMYYFVVAHAVQTNSKIPQPNLSRPRCIHCTRDRGGGESEAAITPLCRHYSCLPRPSVRFLFVITNYFY